MKKSFLFLLMIVSVTIVAQAQMVGTNAKSDRVVLSADNPKLEMVPTVHNVLSADFGYGIFEETYQFGCSYYYLRNWGFQASAHYFGTYCGDGLLFSVGANKRLTDNGYLYANIGLGPVQYYTTDYLWNYGVDYDRTNALGLGVIFAVRNGITLNAEVQTFGTPGVFFDDLCLKIGFGIDLNRFLIR